MLKLIFPGNKEISYSVIHGRLDAGTFLLGLTLAVASGGTVMASGVRLSFLYKQSLSEYLKYSFRRIKKEFAITQ